MNARRLLTGMLTGMLGVGVLSPTPGTSQTAPDRPAESPFAWVRELEAAKGLSLRAGKPLLLLIDTQPQPWERYIERAVLPESALAQVVRGFVWVVPGPDRSEEIRARFHVDMFPTLLLLGPDEENIHRKAGYLTPDTLLDFLREGLRRYERFDRGLDWDPSPPRSDRLTAKYDFATLPAPSSEVPRGIAFIGTTIFVAQGSMVFKLDEGTGEILGSFPLPGNATDLSSDGELLFAVDYCWTSGKPIYVLDPEDGEVVRTIVTRANATKRECAAYGVEIHAGRLRVLESWGKIHEVEPASGNVESTLETERDMHGLAFDGEDLVSLSATGIVFLDPERGCVRRMIPTNYRLRSVGFHGGRFFLMEQPIDGFDRNHDPVRVSPRAAVLYVGSL